MKSFVQQLSADNQVLALNIHRHFERIPYLFPNAKFVHLLRDPRDVAKSCMGMGWAGNVYFGVDLWMATEQSWDLLTTKIKSEQVITLRYEDIVTQPEAELARLCEFIGVSYAPSMLEYDNASTYDKPDSSLAWQWRKKLTAKEVALVEAKAHKLISTRHYEVINSTPYQPNAFEKLALLVQNKWFKLKHGLQRYGFVLFFGEKLTKLLGLTTLHKQYIQDKNAIDIKHLK
nr:sulfotransferase [Methylocucumis oryzae]